MIIRGRLTWHNTDLSWIEVEVYKCEIQPLQVIGVDVDDKGLVAICMAHDLEVLGTRGEPHSQDLVLGGNVMVQCTIKPAKVRVGLSKVKGTRLQITGKPKTTLEDFGRGKRPG